MLPEKIKCFNVILASASPRRKQLLEGLDIHFTQSALSDMDESYPQNLGKFEIPVYLAEKKSKAYPHPLAPKDVLITADTIVWLNNEAINKPEGFEDAVRILKLLSGNTHEVITGVCIRSASLSHSFFAHSEVSFNGLSDQEINYYVNKYAPYDKAGAYGIQEWIGYIGISEIRGSYFNVMGLPVQRLYNELNQFVDKLINSSQND